MMEISKRPDASALANTDWKRRSRCKPGDRAQEPHSGISADEQAPMFEVENVMKSRTRAGQTEYLIRWKDYDSSDDMWVPEHNLDCPLKLKAFRELQADEAGHSGYAPCTLLMPVRVDSALHLRGLARWAWQDAEEAEDNAQRK
jgi:hypothetical protein